MNIDCLRRNIICIGITSALVLATGAMGGCTALYYHGSADQCESDTDCTARGGSFVSTYCSTDHVCVDNLDFCATNADCVTRNNGDPYKCDQTTSKCIGLLSPECTTILADKEDLSDPNYELFGATIFTAINPGFQGAQDAIELARQEWKAANGGLAASTTGGPRRPIVIVGCNPVAPDLPTGALQFPSDTQITAATNHLVNDLKVNAFFGPLPDDEFAAVLPTTLQAQIPLFGTGQASVLLDNYPNRGLYLWRPIASDRIDMSVRSWLTNTYIEPILRGGTTPMVPAGTPLKVALLKETSAYGDSGLATMNEEFTFNGQSLTANGSNFLSVDYGNMSDVASFPTTFAAAVNTVVAFKPNVIVLWGAGDVAEQEISQVEAAWPSNLSYRPYHLHGANLQDPASVTLVTATPSLRYRVFGNVDGPLNSRPAWGTFQQSFYSQFTPPAAAVDGSGGALYDSAYLVFLAASSVQGPLTGAKLAAALPNVTNQTSVQVGPGPLSISDALGRLTVSGASIWYNGVTSRLKCNNVGDCDAPMSVIQIDPTSPSGFSEVGAGYDSDTDTIAGTVTIK